MAKVIGIKYKNSAKVYYFDPLEYEFSVGDGAIVETPRGVEYASVVLANKEVDDSEIVQPLKPVIRKATEQDRETLAKNLADKEKALEIIKEKVAEMHLEMKLVDAEYTFDRSKLIFYFTADGRVDFRDLVRVLASIFKTRIDLRQIYERDEIKFCGAIAPCGRECCCATHLSDFKKVSIKMAKVQGLSLNPQKINGVCGRLMCCLDYENEYYSETFKLMPKVGSRVHTPDGEGTVESNDLLSQTARVKIMLKDGSFDIRTYGLEDMHIGERQTAADIEALPDSEV